MRAGRAGAARGPRGVLLGDDGATFRAIDPQRFSVRIAAVGDVNGDRLGDFVVQAYDLAAPVEDAIQLVHGSMTLHGILSAEDLDALDCNATR